MKLMGQDYNEVTGMTTQYLSHGNGKITIRCFQDVEPALIQNQRELNAQSSKSRVKAVEGIGTKVASIPVGLIDQFHKQGLNLLTCSDARLKRVLNDPDYRKLRTAHGRV